MALTSGSTLHANPPCLSWQHTQPPATRSTQNACRTPPLQLSPPQIGYQQSHHVSSIPFAALRLIPPSPPLGPSGPLRLTSGTLPGGPLHTTLQPPFALPRRCVKQLPPTPCRTTPSRPTPPVPPVPHLRHASRRPPAQQCGRGAHRQQLPLLRSHVQHQAKAATYLQKGEGKTPMTCIRVANSGTLIVRGVRRLGAAPPPQPRPAPDPGRGLMTREGWNIHRSELQIHAHVPPRRRHAPPKPATPLPPLAPLPTLSPHTMQHG